MPSLPCSDALWWHHKATCFPEVSATKGPEFNISHCNTWEMSKTKHRPWGRDWHRGVCVPTVLLVPSGGAACLYLLLKPREGWAVIERFLPVLGHQPPSRSLTSLCSACIHPAVMLHSMRTLRPGRKLCQEEPCCSSQWHLGRLWSTVKHCRAHVDLGSPQGDSAHRNQNGRGYRHFGNTCRSEGVWGTGSEVFSLSKGYHDSSQTIMVGKSRPRDSTKEIYLTEEAGTFTGTFTVVPSQELCSSMLLSFLSSRVCESAHKVGRFLCQQEKSNLSLKKPNRNINKD